MENQKSKVSERDLMYMGLETEKNQIRLIRFEQRRPEQPRRLNLSLHTVSLDEKPRYHCLSYVWGAPDFIWPVYVNGSLVLITPTLGQALDQLEHENLEALWADGICINQQDMAEREAQVKLMSRIYSECQANFAWLGLGDDELHAAMHLLNTTGVRVFRSLQVCLLDRMLDSFQRVGPDEIDSEVVNSLTHLRDAMKLADEHDTRDAFVIDVEYEALTRENIALILCATYLSADADVQMREELLLNDTTAYEGFVASWERLMSCSFWRRVWIVQELIQPGKVILKCGSTSARLEYLHAFRNFLHRTIQAKTNHVPGIEDSVARFMRLYTCLKNPATSLDVIASMRESRFLDEEFAERWDIASTESLDTVYGMLRRCWQLESTVDLDKIYGLMNVSRDVEELQALVDYNKSIGRLCAEVMRMTLIRHGLKLLQHGLSFTYPIRIDSSSNMVNYSVVHPYWPSWMNIGEALSPYPGARGPLFLLHEGRSQIAVTQFRASGTYSHKVSASDFGPLDPWFPLDDIFRVPCRIIGEVKRVCKFSLEAWSRDAEDLEMARRATPQLARAQLAKVQMTKARDTINEIESFFDQEDDLESMLHGKPLWWLFCLQSDVPSSDPVAAASWRRDMENVEAQFPALKNDTHHRSQCADLRSVLVNWVDICLPLTIDTGYVGLGPKQSIEGDKVVIFPDIDVPYVVRPYKDGFKMLGQAYILGVMNGEFLETDPPETIINLM